MAKVASCGPEAPTNVGGENDPPDHFLIPPPPPQAGEGRALQKDQR